MNEVMNRSAPREEIDERIARIQRMYLKPGQRITKTWVDKALREERKFFPNWAPIQASAIRESAKFNEIKEIIAAIDMLSTADLLLVEDNSAALKELSAEAATLAARLDEELAQRERRAG
jgi:hypothetical protein